MRRSFAPSRDVHAAKKWKFSTPFTGPKVIDMPASITQDSIFSQIGEPLSPSCRSTCDLLKLIENSPDVPQLLTDGAVDADAGADENNQTAALSTTAMTRSSDSVVQYFSAVWCKLSARKHKKWEGDAILIVKKSSVTLKDLNGKEIGRGLGYKRAQLENLEDGSRLAVGGKELEIMGVISAENYLSGRCFTADAADDSSDATFPLISSKKHGVPFKVPTRAEDSMMPSKKKSISCPVAPRFDPSRSGALVLPRPSATVQWKCNPDRLPIVDVVVDPVVGDRLRPHQRDGVTFLYECVMQMRHRDGSGAILADEMGLGKTLQCITLIWTLLKQGPYSGRPVIKRALVVAPSSLTNNWHAEFNLWLGRERISVCVADQSSKIIDYAKSPMPPVLITSYELLMRHHEILFLGASFDLIVCDEGHRLKNANTKTSSMLAALPIGRRVVLTGTPIQNDLQEFYALVEFCNPGILGSALTFRKIYEAPILRSKQRNASREEASEGAARAAELARITSLFTLRRMQDVINRYLPPKVEYVVFCRPSSLQITLYKRILESRCLRSWLAEGGHARESCFQLVCIDALKKICNHPSLTLRAAQDVDELPTGIKESSPYCDLLRSYERNTDVNDPNHSGKLRVLASLLRSLSRATAIGVREKVILVSSSTKALDILERFCADNRYVTVRLDGSTPPATRQSLVQNFNSAHSNCFVFLLSTRAGGVGLNLVGASRIVLYDIDWNPANDLQAMSRVWRDGQRRTVHIYRLLTTGTIEEKIYQRQVMKQSLSGSVVDNGDAKKMHFSLEELKDIFGLDETSPCNTHDLLSCDCLKDEDDDNDFVAERTSISQFCRPDTKRKPENKAKNFSMDELMSWKHFRGRPSKADDFQDGLLYECNDGDVTFTFHNVSNRALTEPNESPPSSLLRNVSN